MQLHQILCDQKWLYEKKKGLWNPPQKWFDLQARGVMYHIEVYKNVSSSLVQLNVLDCLNFYLSHLNPG